MASLRQALSEFSANEDRVSGIKIDRSRNIVNSEERKSDRLVQSLSSFSSTLAESLIERDKRKIKDEIKRGRAAWIEADLERLENEGVDTIPQEEKEQFKKDKEDITFGLEEGVDFIALSFVRSANDIDDLRKFLGKRQKGVKIFSKIEDREGLTNIDQICEASDGVMVARGDLGLSLIHISAPTRHAEN